MIHERGYWLSREEFKTHQFDKTLCHEIAKIFCIETAVDVGCGNGSYTNSLNAAGIKCAGYDGSPSTREIAGKHCGTKDFSDPVDIGQYDLVLSLEVGEHIPVQYEQTFIDNLCKAARQYICLSWAVEGQGGTGHVNCRNNDYVIAEMKKRGFGLEGESTTALRKAASIPWFRNTIMVFSKW